MLVDASTHEHRRRGVFTSQRNRGKLLHTAQCKQKKINFKKRLEGGLQHAPSAMTASWVGRRRSPAVKAVQRGPQHAAHVLNQQIMTIHRHQRHTTVQHQERLIVTGATSIRLRQGEAGWEGRVKGDNKKGGMGWVGQRSTKERRQPTGQWVRGTEPKTSTRAGGRKQTQGEQVRDTASRIQRGAHHG